MDPQITPVNLWNQARDFLEASEREFGLSKDFSFPAYFLAGRAIELGLKSFLLLRGADEKKLRSVSHDLMKAHAEAVVAGLGDVFELTADDLHIVEWINGYYKSKDLEYPKTGVKSFPDGRFLLPVAKKIVHSLESSMRAWRAANLR